MSPRQAIRILMLSPVYFHLPPAVRWRLVREYCARINRVAEGGDGAGNGSGVSNGSGV